MASIKFLTGTYAQYSAVTPNADTLYYLSDQGRVFKGTSLFTDQVYSVTAKPTTDIIKGAIYVVTEGTDAGSYYASTAQATGLVAMQAAPIDYTVDVVDGTAGTNEYHKYDITQANSTETGTVVGSVVIPNLKIEKATTPTEGSLNTYEFTYGTNDVVKIEIPDLKDKVVTSGQVVVVTDSTKDTPIDPEDTAKGNYPATAGTYLMLTIANQKAPVFINVQDLCDVYTGTPSESKGKGGVDVTVDNGVITAEQSWGSIE